MMTTLPATLMPLAPRARYVVLEPYTSLGAVLVPNLGLRLLFPPEDAQALTFALTNPLFKATRVGPSGLLLTVARGRHARYCGNVFVGLGPYAVSLLVCTTTSAGSYRSDIIFTAPTLHLPKVPAPIIRKPRVWRTVLADIAFGHNAQIEIKKRIVVTRAGQDETIFVRRFVLTNDRAILGFVVVGHRPSVPAVTGASLYIGRKAWRRIKGDFACSKGRRTHETRCALVVARPTVAVSRWHLIVVTAFGATRISW